MGLETTFNFIDDLNTLFPNSSPDTLAQADDHLRGVKNAVKGSFPLLGQAAVTATAADLNIFTPIGGIIMFTGTISALPANWNFCDGTNGTVDLRNRFVRAANSQAEIGDTGGSNDAVVIEHSHFANHSHTGASDAQGAHTHTVRGTDNSGAGTGISSATGGLVADNVGAALSAGSHNHNITINVEVVPTTIVGTAGTGLNLPAYYDLAYIQRIS